MRYTIWIIIMMVGESLNDPLDDPVYAITLDGNMYSIEKEAGSIRWKIKLDPVIRVSMDSKFKSILFPNPKDGTLYVNLIESNNIKLLPYTIPELVHISPIMSKDGLMFIGEKKDEWLVIDDTKGELLQRMSSRDVWRTCPSSPILTRTGNGNMRIDAVNHKTGSNNNKKGTPSHRQKLLHVSKSEYSLSAYNSTNGSFAWNVTYVTYKVTTRYTPYHDPTDPTDLIIDPTKQSLQPSGAWNDADGASSMASADSSLIPRRTQNLPPYESNNETYYADCHEGSLLTINSTTSNVHWSLKLSSPVISLFGDIPHHSPHVNYPIVSEGGGGGTTYIGPVNLITVLLNDFLTNSTNQKAHKYSAADCRPNFWNWGPSTMAAVYLGQYHYKNSTSSLIKVMNRDSIHSSNNDKDEKVFRKGGRKEDICDNVNDVTSSSSPTTCIISNHYALPSLLSTVRTLSITHETTQGAVVTRPTPQMVTYPRITGEIYKSSSTPAPEEIKTAELNPLLNDTPDEVTYSTTIRAILDGMSLGRPTSSQKKVVNPNTCNYVPQPPGKDETCKRGSPSTPNHHYTTTDNSFDEKAQDSNVGNGLNNDRHEDTFSQGPLKTTHYNLIGKFFPYPVEVISALELFPHPSEGSVQALLMYNPLVYSNKWYDLNTSSTSKHNLDLEKSFIYSQLTFTKVLLSILLASVIPILLVWINGHRFHNLCTLVIECLFRVPQSRRNYSFRSNFKVGKISLDPRSILGVGSLGTVVYKGRFESRDVAVKRVLRDYANMAEREIAALVQSDRHDHVIRYHCAERSGPFVYIAIELCQTSFGACANAPLWKGLTTSTTSRDLCAQMLAGLGHLHSLRIVHRDLKPQNVLVSLPCKKSGRVRAVLSDFGISKNLSPTENSSNGGERSYNDNAATLTFTLGPAAMCGTSGWKPREILSMVRSSERSGRGSLEKDAIDHLRAYGESARGAIDLENSSADDIELIGSQPITCGDTLRCSVPEYDQFKSDIFSSGCVIYYVISGGIHPFGPSLLQRQDNILNNKFDLSHLTHDNTEDICCQHLLNQMLSSDPLIRPSAATCLDHPFFWSAEKKLQYFMDLSDLMDKAHPDMPSVRCLEKGSNFVIKDDWKGYIDQELQSELRKFRSYQGHSLRDLLRAMRNKKHHYQELPQSLKESLGQLPDQFLEYFTSRFPYLLIHLYMVGLTTLSKGNDGSLKKYFPP